MTSAFQDEDVEALLFGEDDAALDGAYRALLKIRADLKDVEYTAAAILFAEDPQNDVAVAGRHLIESNAESSINRIRVLERESDGLVQELLLTHAERIADYLSDAAKAAAKTLGAVEAGAMETHRLAEDLRIHARAAFTPDVEPTPLPEAPLPDTKDWAATTARVHADVMRWVVNHREPKRDMLMLRPSPSTGKTTSMIGAALESVEHRKRVIFAVRTKDMIREDDDNAELRKRIVSTDRFVRLHVITGRDKDNCNNHENVETVANHGYSPGRTVCLACDWHPRNALPAKMNTCDYFNTRIVAQKEMQLARHTGNKYPLILTTHAGLATAASSGGGMFGKLWGADLAIIDEDPTEAFETDIALTESHLAFDASRNTKQQPLADLASLLRTATELADKERRDAARRGFFVDPKAKLKIPDQVHSPFGSNYAARDLHRLLRRALAIKPILDANGAPKSLLTILIDAGSLDTTPGVGELLGFTQTTDLNNVLPHHGLKELANVLFKEIAYARDRGVHIAKEVSGKDLPGNGPDEQDAVLDELYPTFDTVHQARLVSEGPTWTFFLHQFSDLDKMDANIILGDAYAHEEHYRNLFNKPRPTDSTADPVTIVQHVAHFPPGSIVWRIRAFATIGHLTAGNWYEHCTDIAEILRHLAGHRVLIYGHLKLRKDFQEFMEKNNAFGLKQWTYEHWWGGRGKDQYRDWDAVLTISEPVTNIGAVVSTCNARAMRDVKRAGSAATVDLLPRIRQVQHAQMSHGVAHGVRHEATHPRIVHEHERQNMNELAQALHRVRGLMAPKVMIVMGQEIELTADTIAASSTLENPKSDRGDLIETNINGFVTSEEMLAAMLAIEEQFGVFSPLFAHAFSSLTFQVLPSTFTDSLVIPDGDLTVRNIYPGASRPSKTFNYGGTLPGQLGADQLLDRTPGSLVERVWTPPPRWEDVNKRIRDTRSFRDAMNDLSTLCSTDGSLPSRWKLDGQRLPQRYSFYSRSLSYEQALQKFAEVMNDRYGPTVNDVVVAPRLKTYVPF